MHHFIVRVVVCFLSSKPGPVEYMYWNWLREETSVWGHPRGQVQRHRQPVTTCGVSVPLLKYRRPDLNLRGLSSPVPIHGSETYWWPLPPTSSASPATGPRRHPFNNYWAPAVCQTPHKCWQFSCGGDRLNPCSNEALRRTEGQMSE